jgi:hypothetical protein
VINAPSKSSDLSQNNEESKPADYNIQLASDGRIYTNYKLLIISQHPSGPHQFSIITKSFGSFIFQEPASDVFPVGFFLEV